MTRAYSGDAGTDSVLSDANVGVPAVNSWTTDYSLGTPITLTYDWMTSAPVSAPAGGYQNFTAAQQAGAQAAMALLSEVANVTFVYSSTGTANIEFGTVAFGGSSSGYIAGLAQNWWTVSGNETHYTHADVYLTNSFSSMLNQDAGSAGFATMIHELGHALGLDHTFENYTPPSGTDSDQYSVMSYTGHPTMSGQPQTYMLYDIAALQYLYGANTTTRTGDDTYSWAQDDNAIMTIWDADGNDTLSAEGQTRRAIINLNDGEFSSIGSNGVGGDALNNIAIAYNAAIENATGGDGNDFLTGNELSNILSGGLGMDTLFGGGGNDFLLGGANTDTAEFNETSDQRSFIRFGDIVQIFSNSDTERDWADSVEILKFTNIDVNTASIAESDINAYLASNADLMAAFGNNTELAITHYFNYGHYENRSFDGFDAYSYLASYGDLFAAFGNDVAAATNHYVDYGYSEGRVIDAFDEITYIASYGDLINAFGHDSAAGTRHYVDYGANEGRIADFDAVQYVNNYVDLQNAFGTDYLAATLHYIDYGFSEGRTDDIIL